MQISLIVLIGTIDFNTRIILASKNNINDLMAKTLEKFEAMLAAENCQVINVSMGEEGRGLLGENRS